MFSAIKVLMRDSVSSWSCEIAVLDLVVLTIAFMRYFTALIPHFFDTPPTFQEAKVVQLALLVFHANA